MVIYKIHRRGGGVQKSFSRTDPFSSQQTGVCNVFFKTPLLKEGSERKGETISSKMFNPFCRAIKKQHSFKIICKKLKLFSN